MVYFSNTRWPTTLIRQSSSEEGGKGCFFSLIFHGCTHTFRVISFQLTVHANPTPAGSRCKIRLSRHRFSPFAASEGNAHSGLRVEGVVGAACTKRHWNSGPSERQNWTLERTRTFHRPLRVLSPGGKQQCHRTQSVSKGARPKSPPSPAVIPGMRPPRGQPGFCVPSSRLRGSSGAICRTCPCIPPPLLTAQQWFRLGSRLQGFSALAPPGSQETFGNTA